MGLSLGRSFVESDLAWVLSLRSRAIECGANPVEHFDEVEGRWEVGAEHLVSSGVSAPALALALALVGASFDLVIPLAGIFRGTTPRSGLATAKWSA
ncbi:hypothetical protein ACTI_59290 [Actinoplanes sp. OR16]|nr:hypothetical protein ACTI_59290 [Actinoplanes sp. OR16]